MIYVDDVVCCYKAVVAGIRQIYRFSTKALCIIVLHQPLYYLVALNGPRSEHQII